MLQPKEPYPHESILQFKNSTTKKCNFYNYMKLLALNMKEEYNYQPITPSIHCDILISNKSQYLLTTKPTANAFLILTPYLGY